MRFYAQCQIKTPLVCILLCFLVQNFTCQALAVEDTNQTVRIIPEGEISIVLRLIANDIRENYERIGTWSGEIDIKITWLWTGAEAEDISAKLTGAQGQLLATVLQRAEEKTAFAVGADKNLIYVENFREKRCKFLDPVNGRDLGIMSWPHNSGSCGYTVIARPDFLLKAEPYSFEKGTGRIIGRRAVKKASERDQQTGLYGYEDVWDPRRVFFPGAEFTWDNLENLAKHIDRFGKMEFDGYRLKIEKHQKGDITEYKIMQPGVVSLERDSPDDYAIITRVFSDEYGLNMKYWKVASGSGQILQEFSWEYELVNGVYLPKKVVEKHYGANGDVTREKTAHILTMK